MLKSELQPPREGLNADPVLYGVAAGLARLFQPVEWPEAVRASERDETRRDDTFESRGED